MKCVSTKEGQDLIVDIHTGECGNHAVPKTLVTKAYKHGFWWPTAVSDAEELVKRCEVCQFFGN
jgi:hypothetical protein